MNPVTQRKTASAPKTDRPGGAVPIVRPGQRADARRNREAILEAARVHRWTHLVIRKDYAHPNPLPLQQIFENTDYAVFVGAQSLQKPQEYDDPDATANANLAARLPYLFATCRFAHYLKCMVRDKIGGFKEKADMENWLNKWIIKYCCDSGASEEMKAKYPLAAAEVKVERGENEPPADGVGEGVATDEGPPVREEHHHGRPDQAPELRAEQPEVNERPARDGSGKQERDLRFTEAECRALGRDHPDERDERQQRERAQGRRGRQPVHRQGGRC